MRTDEGSATTWAELAPNLGWLLLGTLCAGALINAGPLTVDILGEGSDPALVTRFANAVLLARVPLFMFQAVQAAMLPRLAGLVATGDSRESTAVVLNSLNALHGDLGIVADGDVVLALSYSGETQELLSVLPALVRFQRYF